MRVEGSLQLGLGGGRLVPSFEIGVRHDGGDAETGYGADIGAGLAWSDPSSGVEAEVQARGLLTHEAGGLRERGIAGSLAWDPTRRRSGASPSGCARRWAGRQPCGEHHGLPHAFARQPRFRPPQHGSWAVHRSCLGWAAPCPSGACGEFERPSRSAKDQVAAETARRTCRASDWRPDKRPRTRRSAECGYAPSLFPPSARCSGGTCGSAGRQGGFQSGTALPPCRSAGRQSRLPSGLSPGRRRRPHHRGKVAGTRVG